jgi:hypothetical protein
MTRDLFTLGLGLGAILLTLQGARADTALCTDRSVIVARLAELYGESPQAIGLADGGRLVEVFASPETGTWTITVTAPSGITCLIAAGEHFERVEGGPMVRGDPA